LIAVPILAEHGRRQDIASERGGDMQTSDHDDNRWRFQQRATRWYEWLLILLLLGLAGGVRAASVYKCTDGDGVAYQSQPCAERQQASLIELAPAPAFSPSPQYAVERTSSEPPARATRGSRRETEPMSYECRASDGQVFYRHAACPHSVPGRAQSAQ